MSDGAAIQHGYAGYHYQKVATVWFALRLMFVESRCEAITVEPASEEDISANLQVPDATGAIGANLAEIPFEIQIKSKSSNWTTASFRDVLIGKDKKESTGTRGPTPRARPLGMLGSNVSLRYVFITNAQLDSDLAGFKIARIGDEGAGALADPQIPSNTPASIWPRIGIFPELSPERLELEITAALKHCAHLPHSRIDRCKQHLIQAVERRLLGKADRRWPKGEIGELLLHCGGVLESQSAIVPPSNFGEMEAKLFSSNSIFLVGEPGVGKTAVARELARRLTLQPEPFELIHGVASKPSLIAMALEAPGAHVFLFEDPWGGEKLAQDADMWISELPRLMRKASDEKRFIVTSRASIRHEAIREAKIPVLQAAEFQLEAKHYPVPLRLEIVHRQMTNAAPWQQDWITRFKDRWLKELVVPLSLDHLCDRVKGAAKPEELDIEQLIEESAVGTLSQTCARELIGRGRDTVAGALVLWALHQVHNHVTQQSATNGQDLVMAGGYRQTIDPVRVFQWFVKAGWFKPATEGFMAHPTCLSGIGQFLNDEPALAEETMQALFKGLVEARRLDEAFRILRHLGPNPRAMTKKVREKVEAHLVEVFLAADGSNATAAMSNIAKYSEARDPVTILLKELDRLDIRAKEQFGFEKWRYNSSLSKTERAALAGSEKAEAAARIFVMHVLPDASSGRYDGQALVHFFSKFGWDFGLEFQALANVYLAELDYTHPSVDLFVEGALFSENPPFDHLLALALASDDAGTGYVERHAAEKAAADQSEWDAARASHLDEDLQEYWVSRAHVLRAVVTAKCRQQGFAWIESHPRRDDILFPWADGMTRETSRGEVQALLDWCGAGRRSTAWVGIRKSERVEMKSVLLSDLVSCPIDDLDDCGEAVACLMPLDEWAEVTAIVSTLPFARKAVLLAAPLFHADDKEARLQAWRTTLAPAEGTAFDLAQNANPNKPPSSFDAAVREKLISLTDEATPQLAAKAACVLGRQGVNITEVIDRLASETSSKVRVWVGIAAMLSVPPVWDRTKVVSLLSDADFRIRRLTMRILAQGAEDHEQQLLIAMHADRSGPVRECCAEIIGEQAWTAGEAAVASLLADRRNRNPSSGFADSHPEFHVARAAAEALLALGSLQLATIDACLALLSESSTTRDFELHCTVLRVLARQKDPRLWPLFVSLLDDDWYVEAQQNSGYPRRYFAAWGLLELIKSGNESPDDFDARPIVEAAMHNDSRLAAPCLVLLAYYADQNSDVVLTVLASPRTTEVRTLLVLSCLSAEASAEVLAVLETRVPIDHPARAIIEAPPPADLDAWNQWLTRHPASGEWLKTIQQGEEGCEVLRWALGRHIKGFQPEQLKFEGLSGLLPKGMKHLTLWSMFNE